VPTFSAEGATFGPVTPNGEGRWKTELSVPEALEVTKLEVRALAAGPFGTDPAELRVWRQGDAIVAGVFDLAGWPVPNQRLLVGKRELRTGPTGSVALGAVEGTTIVAHAEWPGLRRTVHVIGDLVSPLDPARRVPAAELSLVVGPPVPVNVRLQVRGREVSYWIEDARGQLLSGREVSIALSSGEQRREKTSRGRSVVKVPASGAAVSISDVLTGVTAVTEVKP
jgi:hypothetical protein